jgi:hypothetical protein
MPGFLFAGPPLHGGKPQLAARMERSEIRVNRAAK